MEPARPSHDFFGEIRGLSLCPGEQTTGIAQRGHEYHHNGMRDGMIIECQRHDEAGSQKRNVQHGEHGDRDMAQPAMAYLSLLMVEGGFKSCACIGVGKLIRHGQRDAAATRDANTHTVMATI